LNVHNGNMYNIFFIKCNLLNLTADFKLILYCKNILYTKISS